MAPYDVESNISQAPATYNHSLNLFQLNLSRLVPDLFQLNLSRLVPKLTQSISQKCWS